VAASAAAPTEKRRERKSKGFAFLGERLGELSFFGSFGPCRSRLGVYELEQKEEKKVVTRKRFFLSQRKEKKMENEQVFLLYLVAASRSVDFGKETLWQRRPARCRGSAKEGGKRGEKRKKRDAASADSTTSLCVGLERE